MDYLLNKSDFNLASADLLIKNNYYAPSVHCSYYSCIQKLLHILFTKLGKTEETLEAERWAEAERRATTIGSHEYMINLIYLEIKKRSGNSRKFNDEINQLKKLRNDSDYKQVQILYGLSDGALKKAKEVHTVLRSSFNI